MGGRVGVRPARYRSLSMSSFSLLKATPSCLHPLPDFPFLMHHAGWDTMSAWLPCRLLLLLLLDVAMPSFSARPTEPVPADRAAAA